VLLEHPAVADAGVFARPDAGVGGGGRRDASSGCVTVELFVAQVWRPFEQADMPADRWPELDKATERLLPVATGALVAIFQRRMRGQTEAALGEIALRIADGAG
jgi:hypothetical protein